MKNNEVKLTPSIWLYTVRSKNSELIQDLEDNHVLPPNKNFELVLKESINCHHIDVTNHIIYNLVNEENLKDNIESKYYGNLHEYCFKYSNFCLFPEIIKTKNLFFSFM